MQSQARPNTHENASKHTHMSFNSYVPIHTHHASVHVSMFLFSHFHLLIQSNPSLVQIFFQFSQSCVTQLYALASSSVQPALTPNCGKGSSFLNMLSVIHTLPVSLDICLASLHPRHCLNSGFLSTTARQKADACCSSRLSSGRMKYRRGKCNDGK